MKNNYLFALLMIAFTAGTSGLKAQAFTNKTGFLNLGLGYTGYFTYDIPDGADVTATPAIYLSYDHGIVTFDKAGTIGIGAFFAMKNTSYNFGYTPSGTATSYTWDGKIKDIVYGLRPSYHVGIANEKIDLYGALSLGMYGQSISITSDDPDRPGSDESTSEFYYGFSAGFRYMLTKQFGLFAEAGYDMSYAKAGLTFHIF